MIYFKRQLIGWQGKMKCSNSKKKKISFFSCQTYEGGFGACPGAEAHGGYSFCGYATLLLLDRESICDRESLLV